MPRCVMHGGEYSRFLVLVEARDVRGDSSLRTYDQITRKTLGTGGFEGERNGHR